ncbi:MAG: hypothetical protein JXK08_08910 [Flavobacteriaceae bacterium]|nr:hypothetical protein [Flavobacteriaceae bacterium]
METLSIDKYLLHFDTLMYKPTNMDFIRLSKKFDKETLLVREYYSNNLYAIGKMKLKTKIGLWQTFNDNKKISEEYWLNGKVVWYSYFDSNNKLIKKVNIGIDAENF